MNDRFSYLNDRNKGSLASGWRFYLLIAAIVGVTSLYAQRNIQRIENETAQQLEKQYLLYQQHLELSLHKTNLSAVDLTDIGVGFIKEQQYDLAEKLLDLAVIRDSALRDAELYAALSKLALADLIWDNNPILATDYTSQAITLLENAKKLDPIYLYTYELLTLAYTNLNQTDLAQTNKMQATLFH